MVIKSFGATIEFAYSPRRPSIPYSIYRSGYFHLLGNERNGEWPFTFYGCEPKNHFGFISDDQTKVNNWNESLTNEENKRLQELLSQMNPPSSPSASMLQGFDGVYFTLNIEKPDEEDQSFKWWMKAPAEWESVENVYRYIIELAKTTHERYTSRQ